MLAERDAPALPDPLWAARAAGAAAGRISPEPGAGGMTTMAVEPALLADLQAMGVVLDEPRAPARRGGAGPSDHRAVTLGGSTVMVPLRPAARFAVTTCGCVGQGEAARTQLLRDGQPTRGLTSSCRSRHGSTR